MKKLYLILFSVIVINLHADIERRAAIDIGSGGTKVAIADVDTDSMQIVEVLFETSFSVPYQASLDKSNDGSFDEETKAIGIRTFENIKGLIQEYNVEKVAAVATSAFRKANNAQKFVTEINEQTQIQVQVIPQREEGEIAFYSALASGLSSADETVVIDIGTGSVQMTATHPEEDSLMVYMGENMGSVAFKNYIIGVIQEQELEVSFSPNPMNEADLKGADSYVRNFARKAYPAIKEKIKNDAKIVGIGRLFYNSIRPVASTNGIINRNDLRAFIAKSLNKSDEELNNPFAHVDVSNCILTLAIMKALHIHEIHPVDTTTTKGLLISKGYWN